MRTSVEPFELTERLQHILVAEAEAEAPHEACGMISTNEKGENAVWRANNSAPDPTTGFIISEEDQIAILSWIVERNELLRAVYHSHPRGSAQPSGADREFARGWPSIAWVIVGLDPAGLWLGDL